MPRIEDETLIGMALAVLEEAAARARFGPQKRTRAIALALAFLASRRPGADRYAFDTFWRSLDAPELRGRTQMLAHSLEWIFGELELSRNYAAARKFTDMAASELGQKDPTGSPI